MTAEQGCHRVCELTDIALGQVVTTETRDGPVAVFRTSTGIYALADTCSHNEVALSEGFVEDDTVECPAHFSQFCLRTGRALTLPAIEPVATYRVEVSDGQVFLWSRTDIAPTAS